MCKVVMKDSVGNIEFIIYNHLSSKNTYRFTVAQLVDELHQYNLDLSPEFVQKEINTFVKSGLVNQNFRSYSICGR